MYDNKETPLDSSEYLPKLENIVQKFRLTFLDRLEVLATLDGLTLEPKQTQIPRLVRLFNMTNTFNIPMNSIQRYLNRKILFFLKASVSSELEDMQAFKSAENFCRERTKEKYEESVAEFEAGIYRCQNLNIALSQVIVENSSSMDAEREFLTTYLQRIKTKEQILKRTRDLLRSSPSLQNEFVFNDFWSSLEEFKTQDPWMKEIVKGFRSYFTSKGTAGVEGLS